MKVILIILAVSVKKQLNINNYSQPISLGSHLLQDKQLCPQLQHNVFNMFLSK